MDGPIVVTGATGTSAERWWRCCCGSAVPSARPKREMPTAARHRAEHGRPQVVVLSVMGAGGNPLLPHHGMEGLVRRAGLRFSMLRPSFFMQNLSTTYRADIRDRGLIEVPAGDGRTSFIDVRDVAEVAARVLGRAEHLGGGCSRSAACRPTSRACCGAPISWRGTGWPRR
jgi:uncharacterized protein YbjT (DUF2867 family)